MFSFLRRKPKTTGDGIGLAAGADHYRAFVGPPEDYDRIAAMAFNLLTSIGLRQQHPRTRHRLRFPEESAAS